jgi:hypothetical protein
MAKSKTNFEYSGWDGTKNGFSVSQMRDQFARTPIVKLGRMALWNCLTKKVVDLKAPTVGLIAQFQPDVFKDMVNSPLPKFLGAD